MPQHPRAVSARHRRQRALGGPQPRVLGPQREHVGGQIHGLREQGAGAEVPERGNRGAYGRLQEGLGVRAAEVGRGGSLEGGEGRGIDLSKQSNARACAGKGRGRQGRIRAGSGRSCVRVLAFFRGGVGRINKATSY